MRKIIAAINMTVDGFCDHTAVEADEEIHEYYKDLLGSGDAILYGRKTYQLMQFWQDLIKNPSGERSMDDFAKAMDKIPKVVFSRTLNSSDPSISDWHSARLADKTIEEEVIKLRQQAGKDIFVGSRSLIIQLLNLKLIDELQLCVHPVIAVKGLPLFDKINDRTLFKLNKTRTFGRGAILLHYEPNRSVTRPGP